MCTRDGQAPVNSVIAKAPDGDDARELCTHDKWMTFALDQAQFTA